MVLGQLYLSGTGVSTDPAQALTLFQRAADAGNAEAQNMTGYLYHQGIGTAVNNAQALKYYVQAAQQHLAGAEYMVGFFYQNGLGVPQNLTKAFEYYQQAAYAGIANAQLQLAALYTQGKAVTFDKVEAYAWLNIAASTSETEIRNTALGAKAVLESSMTTDELTRAQGLSETYFDKIKPAAVGEEVYVPAMQTKSNN